MYKLGVPEISSKLLSVSSDSSQPRPPSALGSSGSSRQCSLQISLLVARSRRVQVTTGCGFMVTGGLGRSTSVGEGT